MKIALAAARPDAGDSSSGDGRLKACMRSTEFRSEVEDQDRLLLPADPLQKELQPKCVRSALGPRHSRHFGILASRRVISPHVLRNRKCKTVFWQKTGRRLQSGNMYSCCDRLPVET
jgi:hypothetical protein